MTIKWIALQVLVPILGPGLAFILYAASVRITADDRSNNPPMPWQSALDPIGWLYAALILYGQTISVMVAGKDAANATLPFLLALFALLAMVAGMDNRHRQEEKNRVYRPKLGIYFFSGIHVSIALIYAHVVCSELFKS